MPLLRKANSLLPMMLLLAILLSSVLSITLLDPQRRSAPAGSTVLNHLKRGS